MITVTEAAQEKIRSIISSEDNPDLKLRTYVQGGGCSGFQYGFNLDEDQNEDDFDFDLGGVKMLVDSISMQYLEGSTIDYKEGLQGSQFIINNPNAQTKCGCGSSFGV